MCYKKIEMDDNRQQIFDYPEKGLPIPRVCNSLNEFSGGKVDCHWHSEFQFGLVLKGKLNYHCFQTPASKIKKILSAGDGFFINSKVMHGYRQNMPGAKIFIFSFAPGFFSSSLVFGNIYQKIILPILHSPIFGLFYDHREEKNLPMLELFRTFHNMNPQDTEYELHGLELLCQIWRQLFEEIQSLQQEFPVRKIPLLQEQRLQKMLAFIHAHYSESITVDMIALSGDTNKRDCFRCFRTLLGQTPTEYLTQYRLSMAAHLLLNTNHSLSSISEQCGFNTVSYFGKLFRKVYGTSPGRYRIVAQ